MQDWDDLKIALAIARHGTLTAAGRALGLNQSTMGRRLAAMEAVIGQPLFERQGTSLMATELGSRVVAAAEHVAGTMAELQVELAGGPTALEGILRLSAPELLIAPFLASRLAPFIASHPGLAVELVADERPPVLARRDSDIALRFSLPDQAELFVRRVAFIAFAVYASPRYVLSAGLDPEERRSPVAGTFSGCDAVGPPPELSGAADAQWFATVARGARPALRVDGIAAQLAAIKAGLGVGLLPCFIGDDEGLTRLTAPGACPLREVWLAVHRELRHAPRLRAMIDQLSAVMKRERPALMGAPRG
ncbi:LysR family transcriptional regulator [Zavarzinia sp.]|uniref:LysR family transcriptional regulator n=1 Tax=Zavarzinia sp. TaxID=2027920 RepID=UPI003BB7A678|nr:LysR family transcriptional regulator [Zavarzinia sp.]